MKIIMSYGGHMSFQLHPVFAAVVVQSKFTF